jgi:hypothetical protein
LPEPEIKDPADSFAVVTATGADLQAVLDAATAHWSGQYLELAFCRDASADRVLRDTVRGLGQSVATNNTAAQAAFGGHSGAAVWGAWRWRLGAKWGCVVKVVNKSAAGAESFVHDMGRPIGMMWARNLAGGDTYAYHRSLGAGSWFKVNDGALAAQTDATAFNSTAPTESAFTLGSAFPNGAQVLVILWGVIDGFADFTSYTANANANGPFAGLSVDPLAFLVRGTSATRNSVIRGRVRDPSNSMTRYSFLNTSEVETNSAAGAVDGVTGGIKLRNTSNDGNASGAYLVAAWGRPIGGVCVAPNTAR